jgi:hypothetical protein
MRGVCPVVQQQLQRVRVLHLCQTKVYGGETTVIVLIDVVVTVCKKERRKESGMLKSDMYHSLTRCVFA